MDGDAAEADRRTLEFIGKFIAEVGLNQKLREYGVTEDHVEALSEQAIHDSCHLTNPVPVTKAELAALYRAVL